MKYQTSFFTTALSALLFLCLPACNTQSGVDGDTETLTQEALDADEEKDLTGTFSADGKNYSGRVSVQQFPATGQYSVLCQDDSDPNASRLIQFVFKEETSARAAGPRTIAHDRGKNQASNEVAVSYDIRYASGDSNPGTFTVNKNGSESELVFEGVEVETVTKEKATVSGKIPF